MRAHFAALQQLIASMRDEIARKPLIFAALRATKTTLLRIISDYFFKVL